MLRSKPRVGLVLAALILTTLFSVAHAARAAARPWLGVYTQELNSDLRDGMDLHEDAGVLVNRVISGGPAARAGLQSGDVILRFGSHAVDSPQDLANLVGDARENQTVPVQVLRNGDRRTFSVTLASRSDSDESPEAPSAPDAPRAPRAPSRLEDMGHRDDAPQARNHDDDGDDDGDEHGDVHGDDHGDDHGDQHGDRHDDSDHKDVRVKVYRNGDGHDGTDRKDVRVKVYRNGDKPETWRVDGDNLDQLPEHVREMLHNLPEMNGNGRMRAFNMMGAGRGRLGVRIESLNEDLAGAVGAPGSDGVLVLETMSDTPAARAGLRAGDVILAVQGKDVKDAGELVAALRDVSGKVSITVSRKGARRTVEAELEDAPRMMMHGDGPMIMHGDGSGPAPGHKIEIERREPRERPRESGDSDSGELRQQMQELRQQLRELRQQLDERHHD